MKVQYPTDKENPWWWTHYQEAILEMLILKDQNSLDAIEGKTNISNKTENQKDSPCKELTLEGLKSLYLLQWGIWTKWEMNMVTTISFWYSIAHMKQAEKL